MSSAMLQNSSKTSSLHCHLTHVANIVLHWCFKICVVHSSTVVCVQSNSFVPIQFLFFDISIQNSRLSLVDHAVVDN